VTKRDRRPAKAFRAKGEKKVISERKDGMSKRLGLVVLWAGVLLVGFHIVNGESLNGILNSAAYNSNGLDRGLEVISVGP
jgi:hypothetical protein